MITLRNVLLSINGACFLLLFYELFRGNQGLEWLPFAITIYLVMDFVYLSLTYPKKGDFPSIQLLFRDGEARSATKDGESEGVSTRASEFFALELESFKVN